MKKLYTLYILIITQGLSLIGSRMSAIAVGLWLFQVKGSTTYLLLIPFFNEITAVFFGGVAGIAVDRWKRKYAMIFGDLGQAVGTILLFVSAFSNKLNIYLIYAAVIVQGVFTLFESIAADAATTMMVPETHRDRVNAIKEMTFPLAGVIAPVVSGFLYVMIGIKGILIIDFITFIVAVIVLIFVNIPDPEIQENLIQDKESFAKELGIGFKYLLNAKGLFGLTIYVTFINFMINGPLELVIPYVTKINGSSFILSIILGVMNLGAFIGAAIIAILKFKFTRVNTILLGISISAVMFLVFGIARMPLLLGVSLFILMMPLPIINAMFKSIIQVKVPPRLQGRVFAAVAQISNAIVPMSFVLTGFLVDNILEPAVASSKWKGISFIIGSKPGSGISLILVLTGIIIMIVSLIVNNIASIKYVEERLANYEIKEDDI
ncbi:MFS transporter [Clostridium sp. YIM B02505]|uniref:MFS transporter n=1 Tax=Clostridium yunnanense TaxID=2800325 RepID=A0ABS1ER96_9CLOT|nr:MFS transporter [Clostridium yunnanense]MBK1811921.1 MFS transporter [Clostridium yunnanense]